MKDQYAGTNRKLTPHDECEGRDYRPSPNPPLGTQHAQRIRDEQTRMVTVAKSKKMAGQFKA